MHNKLLVWNFWKWFVSDGQVSSCCRFYTNYRLKKYNKLNVPMPKDRQQILAMQKQREKTKKKTEGYTPSRVSLQVVGSGARGAPRSLSVSADHAVYLFNCGEGTQRLSHEHHIRLSKVENILITTPTWRNIGGLPGMSLTVQENGVPKIRVHGPKGTIDLFTAIKRFVSLKDLTVDEAACKQDNPYVDPVLSISYVPLYKPQQQQDDDGTSNTQDETIPIDNVDYNLYDVNHNGKRFSSNESSSQRKIPRTEDIIKGGRIVGSMAYICKLPPKPGTLLLDKCVDKGVKPGPLLGKLKAGEDVTLPDGTVVLSSDVCSPNDPGPVFIVIECPDEEYLDCLVNCQAFEKHQAHTENKQDVANCVVHFTPERVIQNRRYREWMEKFAPTTRHMLINEENRCMGSEAVYKIQHKLHLLHPTIFPFISEEGIAVDTKKQDVFQLVQNKTKPRQSLTDDQMTGEKEFPLINRAKTLDMIHLRPLNGFDKSAEIVLTPKAYIDEAFAVDGFLDSLAELQTEINIEEKRLGDIDEYPKIVMLGTGSCIPNKTRNTSGILLRIDQENSIILDCGEGTAGQLLRFYGREQFDKVLATIKVIYVSHLHADHHIGLIGLLNERARVTKTPVVLLAPEQIGAWLRIYHRRFGNVYDKLELIPNKDLDLVDPIMTVAQETRLLQALSGVKFSTVRVKHCFHSFGVAVTLKNGYKIVYSGDTMPCDALVELGANCDLLIHEATMEDDLEDEAKAKLHSTVSQAINIGERMKAKFILLTHFSQRYSKLPHLPNNDKAPNLSKVGIAYDNMQISVSQLSLLPLMYRALHVMFSEFRGLLEEKAIKRQKRLKRESLKSQLEEPTSLKNNL